MSEDVSDRDGKVVVAFCHNTEHHNPGFVTCLVQLLVEDGKRWGRIDDVIQLGGSPRLTSNRNKICSAFLDEHDAPWLLMVDADMLFYADDLEKTMQAADKDSRPVVSGLYFGGQVDGMVKPHAYMKSQTPGAFHPITSIGDGGPGTWDGNLAKVDAVGAGWVLVHRSILELMRDTYAPTGAPFFAEAYIDGQEVGEDIVFCMRLDTLKVPLYLHSGVMLGHSKPGVVDQYEHRKATRRMEAGASEEDLMRWYQGRGKALSEVPEPSIDRYLIDPPRVASLHAAAGPPGLNRQQRRDRERAEKKARAS